jgi:hypothetical protein
VLDPEVERIAVETAVTDTEKKAEKEKPLKPARSEAELTAIKQRNLQILLVATNVVIGGLTVLKVYGIL